MTLYLVAVEAFEEMAVVRAEEMRADVARHVAVLARVLDLDDLGAQIGELHGAVGAGAVLLYRDDAQAGKRQHPCVLQTGWRSTRLRAMMMRCSSLVPSPITSSGASRYSRSTMNSFEYP